MRDQKKAHEYARSEKYVESLFRTNPDLSIHAATKECSFHGRALTRTTVSEIRSRVRREEKAKAEGVHLAAIREKIATEDAVGTLEHEMVAVTQALKDVHTTPPPVETAAEGVVPSVNLAYLTDEEWGAMSNETPDAGDRRELRKQYLNVKLEEDPQQKPHDLNARIREVFGIGLTDEYVYDTVRIAKQVAGLEVNPRRTRRTKAEMARARAPKTKQEKAKAVMRAQHQVDLRKMAAAEPLAQEYLLSWELPSAAGAGAVKYMSVSREGLTHAMMVLRFKDGIPTKDIKVWRPVAVEIGYDIKLG